MSPTISDRDEQIRSGQIVVSDNQCLIWYVYGSGGTPTASITPTQPPAQQQKTPGRDEALDILTIALCMSIGTAVAWFVALYSDRGPHLLLWDNAFGITGAALCAAAIAWFVPAIGVVGLVIAGPLAAFVAIVGGQAIRRALLPKSS